MWEKRILLCMGTYIEHMRDIIGDDFYDDLMSCKYRNRPL